MHASKLSKHHGIEPEFEERRRKGTKQAKIELNMDGIKVSKAVNTDDQKEVQVPIFTRT